MLFFKKKWTVNWWYSELNKPYEYTEEEKVFRRKDKAIEYFDAIAAKMKFDFDHGFINDYYIGCGTAKGIFKELKSNK